MSVYGSLLGKDLSESQQKRSSKTSLKREAGAPHSVTPEEVMAAFAKGEEVSKLE